MEERSYWLGFAVFSGIGPLRFAKLLSHFGTAKNSWEASELQLITVLGQSLGAKFDIFRQTFSITLYIQKLEKEKIVFVTQQEKEFPSSLLQLENAPILLFCRGNISLLQSIDRKIAIVGTRMVTEYGREVTKIFASSAAQSGFVIVSGLALGVDAIAHGAAIENDGKTIAVLGCGIDCCYPRSNSPLYREIVNSSGLVISEYALGVNPSKGSFPARNRIVAGLSEAILVTEGGEDSGSIITAMEGVKYGKKVFAVPGPITSRLSKGPFSLLSKGGMLVTSPEEMLLDLGVKRDKGDRGTKGHMKGETEDEQRVIDLLENEALHFDEIVKKTGIDSSQIGVLLSMMEMKGYVKNLSSGKYTIF